ncbi:glycosyltransferase family 4 protein [Cohnella sp. AR92]|uniref:glycosyltransferase family 4 protein n=1 Tax=Cohnella sp. AR92 TaxID=648716 RepID=UPI000F8CE304|nr:glycosyltransferase family 4 protein [Cohnella sp. AR92]RUS45286.1 glycosyltransferase [Cohnella sp. AR92]
MKSKLYILHESGAPRHFEALFFLNKNDVHYDEIISSEFSVTKQLIKSFLKQRPRLFFRALRNLRIILYFLFTRDKEIIIGAAPYDWFIYYLCIIKRRHKVIYYSSWPYWDFSKYPKKIFFRSQKKKWEQFLKDIRVVAVTEHVKKGLQQYTRHITVIPHCINEQIFKPSTHKSNESLRILYVGRLVEEKGLNILFNLIGKFKGRSDIEWWFVGDGPLRNQVESLSSDYSTVRYLGHTSKQNELAVIYNQCHVLVLPSLQSKTWEELFGIVLIEAMACGTVPISTDSIGPKSIIKSAEDGFIISSNDIERMLGKCIESCANDRKLLSNMSMNAVNSVKRKYTISETAKLWKNVLKKQNEVIVSANH